MSIFSQRSRYSRESPTSPKLSSRGGFTLIELLVVMAIVVTITGALLFRQSRFDSSTLLRSLAYSVSLSVRQAQVYGTSVFGTTTSQTVCGSGVYQNNACFAPGYGIHVDISTPAQYLLFADFNNNGAYNAGEVVQVFSLGQGYTITRICGATGGGIQYCSGGGGVTWLSMVFRRPNPEPCIATNLSPTTCALGASATYATSSIRIQGSGATRSVFINNSGQISVGNPGT